MKSKAQIPAIVTDLAYAGHGDNIVRGHWVGKELLGREGFWSVFGLALTGKLLPQADAALLDHIAAAVFVPDPRIWPLKAAWLAGAYGSIPVGAAAPLLFLETASHGPWVCANAACIQQELADVVDGQPHEPVRALLRWLDTRQDSRLAGFGVVARAADERVNFIRRVVMEHGLAERRQFRAFSLAALAFEQASGLRPNIGSALAACFLDMGFTPAQCAQVASVLAYPQLLASAAELGVESTGGLRELHASALSYLGPGLRTSARACLHPEGAEVRG